MSFGENIKFLMDSQNISQKQLAQELNISASALGNYIRNVREPDFQILKRIATYFNVSTDLLLDHHTHKQASFNENKLLYLFYSMSKEQQDIYIEQGQAFIRNNHNNKKSTK